MFRIFITFCLVISAHILVGQDFLQSPGSNPKLFKTQSELTNEKTQVFEQRFIYEYDTLELPFIDDFSKNHFPERVTDTSDARLTDTLIFAILENDVAIVDTFGFTDDTTFTYLIDTNGDTLSITPNSKRSIKFANVDSTVLFYFSKNVFPAYNINNNLAGGRDTIGVAKEYEQDTATYFIVPPNPNDFYTDRSAYLNNTFGINPPSIGVVTFDGLDEFGMAYDFENQLRVRADEMTSVPINLGNLPDDSVYFSFFYEPKGMSIDKLEVEDSLVLEFYDPTKKRWGNIWRSIGFNDDSVFIQLNILVPKVFHQNGFQFRFRNYASSTGAFDQWHIDYIYLNNNRRKNDTTYKDVAYVYDAPSLLKDYTAMPWFHYINNPEQYIDTSAETVAVNNFDDDLSVFNKIVIPDSTNGSEFYRFPTNPNAFVVLPEKFTVDFTYPLSGFSFPRTKVTGAGTFTSIFDLDFRPNPIQEPDFIRSNDTVYGKTILKDYYAYDDGTAEAGYGVNPSLSIEGRVAYMAVEYNLPFSDTLKGVWMYFLPQHEDITKQTFVLTVWNSIDQGVALYEKTIVNNPQYSDDNGYLYYGLDSALVVNDTFYVGMKMIGRRSLNVGYDLNRNSKSKIFWSQDGSNWSNPTAGIRDGSLMIRPVFRVSRRGVGLSETDVQSSQTNELTVYPNPAQQSLNFDFTSGVEMTSFTVTDISGRTVYQNSLSAINSIQRVESSSGSAYQYHHSFDISALKNGMYLLFIKQTDGQIHSKKFIVQH